MLQTSRLLQAVNRRHFLRLGLSLTPWAFLPALRAATSHARAGDGFGKAKSVILVYASGGQSQLDTWDPKPDAPAEIRGEFRSIPTAVPGSRFCEYMPLLARLANRFTVVRSLSHEDTDHGSATYLALTGHYHARKSSNPPVRGSDAPTYGAVLKHVRPLKGFPYTAVHVNGPAQVPLVLAPGQFAGALGKAAEPLLLGDVSGNVAAMRGLDLLPELSPQRRAARQRLLQQMEKVGESPMKTDPHALDLDGFYRQAHELLGVPKAREAFDIEREHPVLRERYGRSRIGQACLMARRLVEAGVPFITVIGNHSNRGQDQLPEEGDAYGWDTHADVFGALKHHLLPRFDQSVSALLIDLDQRGLLEQTLVVCMGEFGRAPRVAVEPGFIGNTAGRKHWASVYSVMLAGAGVARGGVVGASDAISSHPATVPLGPWDLAATMFAALGIDPQSHYLDLSARPMPITTGKPIRELYR